MHFLSGIREYLGIISEKKHIKAIIRKTGGNIVNPMHIQGSKYCSFGKSVRIKEYSRIDCYDSFANINPELFTALEKAGS